MIYQINNNNDDDYDDVDGDCYGDDYGDDDVCVDVDDYNHLII